MKVVEIKKTCQAYPAQWEGALDDGRKIYIRYRSGNLTLRVSRQKTWDVMEAVKRNPMFTKSVGNGGCMEFEEMVSHVRHLLDFGEISECR
jgi:hypothetical protein